ncbi:MAG: carboxymuconolactone decarboxylase family protein [Actinobacteria bacterium]|nr:carboxymuconolactone decarboxylase family protein [Actinomycetota bacterium]
MARLPYADRDRAPEPVREALDALPPLNIFRMVANAETAFRPWLRLGGALLSALELDPRLRELAILHVGRLERAEYEWVQHVPIARGVGATVEEIAAIDRGELEDDALDSQTRAVLRFTTEAVREVRVSEEALAGVREQGLSPREVVELLLVISYYMGVARLTESAGVEVDGPLGDQVAASAARPPQR